MSLNILILGVNGFIGSHLAEQILAQKDWDIYSLDLNDSHLKKCQSYGRFHFLKGDMRSNLNWIEEQIKNSDAVFPLVAIATPALYVQDPLRVFELDFEANLEIIRLCVKYHKHVIFPSTSEVYGMCPDEEFDEESSHLVLGPIAKSRWIYSCCKQLLDRILHAYGKKEGLPYTIFRPFNWLGPRLDNIKNAQAGGSRVVTQFLGNILRNEPIQLVEGGLQRRSFTAIEDAIEALLKIVEYRQEGAYQKIFNIGNPANDFSIKELAELLVQEVKTHEAYRNIDVPLVSVAAENYYGSGYQDLNRRIPSIKNAKTYLNWQPKIDLHRALQSTVAYYIHSST